MKTMRDFRIMGILTIFVFAFVLPSGVQAELTWATTNQFAGKVVNGFNDEEFIRTGGCLDWAVLQQPGTGYSVFSIQNSDVACEFGALFHIQASGSSQKFDVWALVEDISGERTPPTGGILQCQIRRFKSATGGLNASNDVPVILGSSVTIPANPATAGKSCWQYGRIDLSPSILLAEGDYWFTVSWSAPDRDTFTLVHDTDANGDGLWIGSNENCEKWDRIRGDPMIVISQDPTTPLPNEPPHARISSINSGKTNVAIKVDGSLSDPGAGYNRQPDSLTYLWEFDSKPEGSDASFTDDTAVSTTFTPDVADEDGDYYTVKLTVTDRWDASDSITKRIHVTQSAPPSVEVPTMSPAAVHALNTSKKITFSVQASDPDDENPDFEYSWHAVNRGTGESKDFSASPSPEYSLSGIGLGAGDRFLDTYLDVTVTVTNNNTKLSTTSPVGTLLISQWPRLTFTVGQEEWTENFGFNVPVNVRFQAQAIELDISNAYLRVIRPGIEWLAFDYPLINSLAPGRVYETIITFDDRLEWDKTACISPIPTGPMSKDEEITVEAVGVVDDNGYEFVYGSSTEIPTFNDYVHSFIISVPTYKILKYGEANRAFVSGIGHSVEAALLAASAFFGCVPCAIQAAILFAAEALEMAEYRIACDEARNDPPGFDPDFMTVVTVDVPEIDTTSASAPDDMTYLAMVAAEQMAFIHAEETAYDKTYNKLFGAYQAGSRDGALLQGTELIRHGGILDREFSTQAANLLAAQDAVGIPSVTDIKKFQQDVAADGLPQREIEVLQQLGAGQAEIDEIEAQIVSADPDILAAGLSDDIDKDIRPFGDFYTNHSRDVAPGGYVLVSVTEPLKGQPVLGTINIQARVVHKKETTSFCICGPTLATTVQVDGQIFNSVPYPQAPWCPTPPQPFPQAVPVQLDTTTLTDGAHTVTVTAHDACQPGPAPADPREHINMDTVTFFVDNTPPTIMVTSQDADPDTAGIQVRSGDDITYTADDPAVNGYASGLVDPSNGVIPTQFNGSYDVTIRVADRAGNAASVTVSVIEDMDGNGIPDSIDDMCPCAGPWRNHGDYVSCVSRAVNAFRKAGRISGNVGAVVRQAAKSNCGKKTR